MGVYLFCYKLFYMMYYYTNNYVPFHMFGFGSFGMILVYFIILYELFVLFREVRNPHHHKSIKGDALQILKERYAQGEITKEEYFSMKKDIE